MRPPKKFRVRPNSTCPICGTEFYAEPNRIRAAKNGRVYCSVACRSAAKTGAGRKKLGTTQACRNCGREFYVKRHRRFDGSNPQYCGRKCMGEFVHKAAVARNTRLCAHCGREFSRSITFLRKTEAATGGKVYCSSVCSHAATRNRGKNKFETDFHELFPELVYTGDGSWVLHDRHGGMNPDFILPGGNKVIELWGNYWHRGQDPRQHAERLAALGYDCLVIWENDFRKHVDQILALARNFLSGCSVHSL